MTARTVTRCGLCGSGELEPVLSLGSSPPTCVMQPVGRRAAETHYPLELLRCEECTLVQLGVVVDPAVVFPPDYPYSSGNSRALHANFEDLADQANLWHNGLGAEDLVVDIGANDGTLLSKFPEECITVAVEPTWQGLKAPVDVHYQEPFTEALAATIVSAFGKAKVITATNVLAHVEDIHDVMAGIKLLLADDGILIAENHDLASVVTNGQWDTVYHEHLRYFDPASFTRVLRRYELRAQSWKTIPTHGGSFRVIAGQGSGLAVAPPARDPYDFGRLQRSAAAARRQIRQDIGHGVYGIGATARATTIINYCGLDVEDVACVCEVPGSDKIGHYIPGTRIPVVDEEALFRDQPPRALLFSWHLADGIVPKLRDGGYEGTFAVPLPSLHHIYSPRLWLKKGPEGKFG